ncbi:PREDICTED: uncharacterized protein LOC108972547 isoform X2 [Bactrocera latifrons]|uniref:uncharacterized protein LOC108972547 isoform X2 n=1 Tax=Bactrocera latifrons TaxID=174628 RepID=UPI0008DD78C4|nr:PREDICTED: uncharacterized protein LOC108972547 isoform X2 [Bactrocera latifrons]
MSAVETQYRLRKPKVLLTLNANRSLINFLITSTEPEINESIIKVGVEILTLRQSFCHLILAKPFTTLSVHNNLVQHTSKQPRGSYLKFFFYSTITC